MLLKWAAVIGYKRADHFTPMMTSSGDSSTLSGDCSTIRTISNIIKMMWYKIAFHPKLTTYTCTQYERWKPKIYGLHRCLPKEKWEIERFLLVLAPIGFLWNNLWSVGRYIMGSLSGRWRQGGNDQQCLAALIWKYRSGFGDHRFIFSEICFHITHFTQMWQILPFG